MSITANQWLSRFRVDITSNSNRIYANGRQQVEVTVTVEPRSGQTVTEEQLDSIALLEIDENGEFLILNDLLIARNKRNERYEAHAARGSNPQNLLASTSATRHRKFYVSSRHRGGTLSTIYAGIYMNQDTHFETNVAPFKSSAVIESVTPHRFSAEHFELNCLDLLNKGNWDIDEYQFAFRDPNYRIAKSIAYGVPAATSFHRQTVNNNSWYTFNTADGYRSYCTAYSLDSTFKDEFHLYIPQVEVNKRPGQLTLLRMKERIDAKLISGMPVSEWAGDSIWGIIDQHGNEHIVKFFAIDAGNLISFKMHY
ncbi:hypothetical protein [Pseudomonas maumuensis]|uniref:Uncharacterized protein n=1 Tax=Pseudomonas maumuensis TaxID=2842354 RepID=A0ABX8NIR4_9PSED|nr:hypothetical protein [Pseudomonas maumuensis]QXH55458.1 hypothetical protein KSS90_19285 [Pseudomonas maumuensis]